MGDKRDFCVVGAVYLLFIAKISKDDIMETGTIYNIQRFSLHDGPGVRTTVFLKGCPMQCCWCHNPEGISRDRQLLIKGLKCLGCQACMAVCPQGAISFHASTVLIDQGRCSLCMRCTEECPAAAIEFAGKEVSVDELIDEVVKDRIIYEESAGGVTFSGGEPLYQPEFLLALLQRLKNEDIHTVVDTSGYAEWSVLEAVAGWTDLFLFDLKMVDLTGSLHYTGVSNEVILQNLKKLAQRGCSIQVRMPLVPTVNDDSDSIILAGEFLQQLGLTEVQLLPYHNLGVGKYKSLGQNYKLAGLEPPSPDTMLRIKKTLMQYGLIVKSEVDTGE
ncbi:MAG TPA: glycyl-radical enzyme activating protein [Candidatus Limnocylindrales bacterium]|nr:glycyl-radical enzyme activating protein [Candidatus Limnocylindrales bacterium]